MWNVLTLRRPLCQSWWLGVFSGSSNSALAAFLKRWKNKPHKLKTADFLNYSFLCKVPMKPTKRVWNCRLRFNLLWCSNLTFTVSAGSDEMGTLTPCRFGRMRPKYGYYRFYRPNIVVAILLLKLSSQEPIILCLYRGFCCIMMTSLMGRSSPAAILISLRFLQLWCCEANGANGTPKTPNITSNANLKKLKSEVTIMYNLSKYLEQDNDNVIYLEDFIPDVCLFISHKSLDWIKLKQNSKFYYRISQLLHHKVHEEVYLTKSNKFKSQFLKIFRICKNIS